LDGGTSVLRRISFLDFTTMKKKDLERKFNWMSLSAEGLLLAEMDAEKIWVVDPANAGGEEQNSPSPSSNGPLQRRACLGPVAAIGEHSRSKSSIWWI